MTDKQPATTIVPVIMCGGSGTRLWPASVPSYPKQFLPLVEAQSCFQQTMLRARRLWPDATPLIVTGSAHAALVREQLAAIGATAHLMIEPEARDSAPAIAAAALWIEARDPNAIAFVLASDHHIGDLAAFTTIAERAVAVAREGYIVTLGITPSAPATAYGYISPGAALSSGAFRVAGFVEKPDLETAQRHRAAGFLWNSGMFVATAATLVGEVERHAPAINAAAREALSGTHAGDATKDATLALGSAFRSAPKISIDYAVMEKTDRAAVIPGAFGWSDLGAWNAVWDIAPRDADGNAVHGEAVLVNAAGNLVRAGSGVTVAVIGARNLAIVAERDTVLVCDLAASQDVKRVVDEIKRRTSDAPKRDAEDPAQDAAQAMTLWLNGSALPLWWALGADPRGGFHEAIDQSAIPVDKPRRARVQTRQVYVYAAAGRLGWPGPWRQAAEHGMSFFLKHYRRPDGLFRTLVAPDGAPRDETAMLYDQAFALLAMAALYQAAPERADLKREAETLRNALHARRHVNGGFIEHGAHEFQSNAHMHLLEAALAWAGIEGGQPWIDLADEIVALCLTHFIDPAQGYLREFFGPDWQPVTGDDGHRVEPGHQFEWAWLLNTWATLRGRADAAAAIPRLIAHGRAGIDPRRGVVMNGLRDDGTIRDADARLWPQCEWLRTALMTSDQADAQRALAAIKTYLDVPVPGLWRDVSRPDGSFTNEPAPASSLYHLVGAISALRR